MKTSGSKLKKMPPTRALFFAAMPCEKTAAHIRNKAIDGLQQDDMMAIGYRYLQSRKGKKITGTEVMAYSVVILLALRDLYSESRYAMLPQLAFYLANLLPNISNTLRYHEVETQCAAALTNRFGKQAFDKIKALSYDKSGLQALSLFMNKRGIDTSQHTIKEIEPIAIGCQGALLYFMPQLFALYWLFSNLKNLYTERKVQQREDEQPGLSPNCV